MIDLKSTVDRIDERTNIKFDTIEKRLCSIEDDVKDIRKNTLPHMLTTKIVGKWLAALAALTTICGTVWAVL